MSEEKTERRSWTPEEVLKLRQMVADYSTGPELAAHFGRPIGAIHAKLSSMGIKIKKRPTPEPHGWGGVHEIPKPQEAEIPCEKSMAEVVEEKPPAPEVPSPSMLDEIADKLRVIAAELTSDPKSPRGWRLFGQVQALVNVLGKREDGHEAEI